MFSVVSKLHSSDTTGAGNVRNHFFFFQSKTLYIENKREENLLHFAATSACFFSSMVSTITGKRFFVCFFYMVASLW